MKNLTKQLIKNTFNDLLEKENLSKITIQELADACGIGRNTFYYHYQDIYMLLEEILDDELEVLKKDIQCNSEAEVFSKVTNRLIENKKKIRHVYKSVDRELLENYMARSYDMILRQFINLREDLNNKDPEEIEFAITFFKHALVGMSMEWFGKNLSQSMLDNFVSGLRKYMNSKAINKLLDK